MSRHTPDKYTYAHTLRIITDHSHLHISDDDDGGGDTNRDRTKRYIFPYRTRDARAQKSEQLELNPTAVRVSSFLRYIYTGFKYIVQVQLVENLGQGGRCAVSTRPSTPNIKLIRRRF